MSSDRKKAVEYADKWFSKYIRKRDGRCVVCNTTKNLQCGHLFSRKNYSLRWDERNAYCQCRGCNLRHEHDPAPLTLYYMRLYHSDDYERLYREWNGVTKISTADIRLLGDRFKMLYENIEEGACYEGH